ncbi:hypothetical protein R1flu_024548 [Riccia fluitans]|uniref:Uncharacterized protein n=1 Tax=Riccia fluitans TaxID=41844 RepID=A0ABD1XY65_9MARC
MAPSSVEKRNELSMCSKTNEGTNELDETLSGADDLIAPTAAGATGEGENTQRPSLPVLQQTRNSFKAPRQNCSVALPRLSPHLPAAAPSTPEPPFCCLASLNRAFLPFPSGSLILWRERGPLRPSG